MRFSIAFALATLLFVTVGSAQQTSHNTSTNSARDSSALPPGPVLGGDGTKNYIPIWTTPTYLQNSVIYQASGGNVGIGTTSPGATLDVDGVINSAKSYASGGSIVLSVGSLADENLFLGVGAGVNNAAGVGRYNTFSGYLAGAGNNTGASNTFFGAFDGTANTAGYANAYYGAYAGQYSTTGGYNTLLGWDAGSHSGGTGNTFTGAGAGVFTTGYYNTFYGYSTGGSHSGGSFNTFVGFQAGLYSTGSDNVYIANAGPLSGAEYNTIRIGMQGHGDAEQNVTYIAGIYGSTSSAGVPVYVNSDGLLGTQTSSLRFKEQVRDMGDSSSGLLKLRPVTFLYKAEYDKGERTLQYGLIAEEVAKVYPELVAYENDGQPYSVRYQYLTTMLLNEAQKQYHRAETEARVITEQEGKIEDLERRLSRLEKMVGNEGVAVAQK